jgi:hypothetical protein
MIDLNKPIRWKYNHTPATVCERFGSYVVVRWQGPDAGLWAAQVHTVGDADAFFENIPPEPRRVTVWPVWRCNGSVTLFQHEESAHRDAETNRGLVGKPTEIVEEYP